MSSIHVSYVLAGILAASLLFARLTDFWPWFSVGMLAVGFQIPLLIGIAIAKFRVALPPTVGHAEMYPNAEPYAQIGWLKALGGFLSSAFVVAVYALCTNLLDI